MVAIQTDRLQLRLFTSDDLDAIASLWADPEVMKHIPTGIQRRETSQASLDNIIWYWSQHNFGYWAVIHKDEGNLIGWCGLTLLIELSEIELGAGLSKLYWGTGFAMEAVKAVLRYGFEKMGLARIVGLTLQENIAAQRGLKKLGMRYERNFVSEYGYDYLFYAISREAFSVENPS